VVEAAMEQLIAQAKKTASSRPANEIQLPQDYGTEAGKASFSNESGSLKNDVFPAAAPVFVLKWGYCLDVFSSQGRIGVRRFVQAVGSSG
jgi:hypothetical protein